MIEVKIEEYQKALLLQYKFSNLVSGFMTGHSLEKLSRRTYLNSKFKSINNIDKSELAYLIGITLVGAYCHERDLEFEGSLDPSDKKYSTLLEEVTNYNK